MQGTLSIAKLRRLKRGALLFEKLYVAGNKLSESLLVFEISITWQIVHVCLIHDKISVSNRFFNII